mmetsp:Transcript_33393/g.76941  ORF Transcript_33393/g.76941 Transcript_33393/m.76941 type:complete len:121 (+) Transcript_33393:243-605(+)
MIEQQKKETNRKESDAPVSLETIYVTMGVLRLAWISLLISDGFAEETGTVLQFAGSVRLVLAFTMIVLRMGLQVYPLVWLSWSLQVVICAELPSFALVDQLIAVIGLATIRIQQTPKRKV